MDNQQIVEIRSLIVHDHKMLIVRHDGHSAKAPQSWRLPSDLPEFHETLEETAARIAKEQVGLDVSVSRILYASTYNMAKDKKVIEITYLCEAQTTDMQLTAKYKEAQWCSKSHVMVKVNHALGKDLKLYRVLSIPELQSKPKYEENDTHVIDIPKLHI